MTSAIVSVRKLAEHTITAQEKGRIVQILLAAFRGDLQVAAMTGGQAAHESALFQCQLNLCLRQGEIFVAGQGQSIDGVMFVYGPDQEFNENSTYQDFVSKLSPEMQQWWSSYFRPKMAELSSTAFGPGMRKASWNIWLFAVDPERQRCGIGRYLLEKVLHKADAGKQRSCLQVNNDAMVQFFSKFGFRVRATKNFGSYQGGFPLFCMLR